MGRVNRQTGLLPAESRLRPVGHNQQLCLDGLLSISAREGPATAAELKMFDFQPLHQRDPGRCRAPRPESHQNRADGLCSPVAGQAGVIIRLEGNLNLPTAGCHKVNSPRRKPDAKPFSGRPVSIRFSSLTTLPLSASPQTLSRGKCALSTRVQGILSPQAGRRLPRQARPRRCKHQSYA